MNCALEEPEELEVGRGKREGSERLKAKRIKVACLRREEKQDKQEIATGKPFFGGVS